MAGEATSIVNQTYSLTGGSGPSTLVSNVKNGPFGSTGYSLSNGLNGVTSFDAMGRVQGKWVCSGSSSANCSGGTTIYGYSVSWKGDRLVSSYDSLLNANSTFGYDEFDRLTSRTGTAPNFTWVYDRWGNRWDQNVTAGSGPAPQLTINTSTNQITGGGYAYDAAGNMTNDGYHSYTYDAEGNMTAVDGGSTLTAVYDALNHKVRAKTANSTLEFLFDQSNRVTSNWTSATVANEAHIFWDGAQLAFRSGNGDTYFAHKDWVNTDRVHSGPSGTVGATYTSLPWGDGGLMNYSDGYAGWDFARFADMDANLESSTYHATLRQYAQTPGRWMSPDPYAGSYDFGNPQSLNRYAYALNNPLFFFDPVGDDSDPSICYLLGYAGCGGGAVAAARIMPR